jgi:hypothetical protein
MTNENPYADLCEEDDHKIVDRAGHVWFQGMAVERAGMNACRFIVLKIGGKTLEVEMVASVNELAAAAVALSAAPSPSTQHA